jgi:hypothetical protein
VVHDQTSVDLLPDELKLRSGVLIQTHGIVQLGTSQMQKYAAVVRARRDRGASESALHKWRR